MVYKLTDSTRGRLPLTPLLATRPFRADKRSQVNMLGNFHMTASCHWIVEPWLFSVLCFSPRRKQVNRHLGSPPVLHSGIFGGGGGVYSYSCLDTVCGLVYEKKKRCWVWKPGYLLRKAFFTMCLDRDGLGWENIVVRTSTLHSLRKAAGTTSTWQKSQSPTGNVFVIIVWDHMPKQEGVCWLWWSSTLLARPHTSFCPVP